MISSAAWEAIGESLDGPAKFDGRRRAAIIPIIGITIGWMSRHGVNDFEASPRA
jgi:hypothetical protein